MTYNIANNRTDFHRNVLFLPDICKLVAIQKVKQFIERSDNKIDTYIVHIVYLSK